NQIKLNLIRRDAARIAPGIITNVMGDHLRILHALAARDVAAAVDAITVHIGNARTRALHR
ncbi:FCD domain-containing protein, partial [Mycobacterium tuberculosis]|nr:FCD domain-containing protein [Mycobacterium tuberculosis]